ncbi:hypothetical protein AB0A77_16080 [Streptomyces varsoviensis]|uniref:hypothetical protein n=1 Tax=Streptomyces varsoviensis TaxID=67373 RepID=UPI0033F2E65B
MSRLLAATVTAAGAAALAVGAAFGIVALLGITPDQPNDPLVTFPEVTAEGTVSPSVPSVSSRPSRPPSSGARPSGSAAPSTSPSNPSSPPPSSGARSSVSASPSPADLPLLAYSGPPPSSSASPGGR